jgi:hypothetical protein
MFTRLGDPTRLFMKPENPLFFFSAAFLESFVSSEYLLELISWVSPTRGGVFSLLLLSPVEKL